MSALTATEINLDILEQAARLSHLPYTIFFDSNRPEHPESKWSYLCFSPIETITFKNGALHHNDNQVDQACPFSFLQERLDNYNFECNHEIPYTGGLAGYWGYDLGRQLEDIPDQTVDDLALPDMAAGIYTNLIAHNHQTNKTWLIGDLPEAQALNIHPTRHISFEDQKTEAQYASDIQKAIDYIHAGEIYQANLSRRFDSRLPKDFNPFFHYAHLREINPAPFSAFMNFENFQLSSCSPERFLKLSGNQIETKPIKGTLPAHKNPQELIESEKDRAENLMIVDLLRNDISKVCKEHSVKVPKLCEIETFEGLHHLVSTVTGELKENETALSLLKACFPGGSITGAPKIRAMEIIEELEETRRGPYCGAMGYVGFNGHMDTNIIIRTLIYKEGKAYLQTGSGIVSDSIPENEVQEGLDKAQKIFESFSDMQKGNAA